MSANNEDREQIANFIATRDPDLREAIILRYVPLVHFVLGRLGISRQSSDDYDDLVGNGLLGLIDAVDRFDAGHGAQFSTYATLRIRGEILDHLRKMDWLPRSARKRARQVEQAVHELWSQLGRAPEDDELGLHLNMDRNQLQKAISDAGRVIISLDQSLTLDESEAGDLHEVIADETIVDPDEKLKEADVKTRMANALAELEERERLILSLYYYDGLTMKEIGELLQVSESRICQLHARSVLNLKAQMQLADAPAMTN
jgi:RNA polymerase sigma factor for flagellar operon FliA